MFQWVYISSRTDSGVHALNSTAHVDLDNLYSCYKITQALNRFFDKNQYSIRILNTRLVPQTFHCRFSAISRTYLYRLAVIKKEHSLGEYHPSALRYYINVPIEEENRCVFNFNPQFDLESARKAASLIEGLHDFRSFMGTAHNSKYSDPKVSTIRHVDFIRIEKVSESGLNLTLSPYTSDIAEQFDYYNVTIKARSFLYRQVRRTVGVLLAVAQGKLDIEEVSTMLRVPSRNSWPSCVCSMPAHGLYLCKVDYRPEDLMLPLDYVIRAQDSR